MSEQRNGNGPAKRPTGEVGAPNAPVQAAADNRATGTDTVSIACNIPMGHILQIFHYREEKTYMQNGREVIENVATLDLSHGQWVVHGPVNRSALAASGSLVLPDFHVEWGSTPGCGYAITPGIPRDFWDAWYEQNKRNPLVLNKNIFMASSESRARSQAKELKDVKSGYQGLNPNGDYRVPSGRNIRQFSALDNQVMPEPAERDQ